jgi:hypothetical protein
MIPGGERLTDLDKAWAERHHGTQLRAVRRGAEGHHTAEHEGWFHGGGIIWHG